MSVLQTNVVPRVHRLGSPFVNWYVVEDGNRLTVVDAGLPRFATDLERDLHELGHRPEDVEAVVLTHSDADHTGVATALREAGATVYVHGYDQGTLASPGPKGGEARPQTVVPHLRHPQAWRTMVAMARGGGARPAAIEGPEIVSDGDVLDVPGRPKVIHTPGHTPGQVAVYVPDERVVFTGDTVFSECQTWLMTSDIDQWVGALDLIAGLDVDTVVPGHGPVLSLIHI